MRPDAGAGRRRSCVLGVVNTGIAYWLNYGAIAQVGATAASLVTYLIPPVAIVAGWLVLDEPVGWQLVVGPGPDHRRCRGGAAAGRPGASAVAR